MPEIDGLLIAISAPSINAKSLQQIRAEALKASKLPTRFVRLEGEGANLFQALDGLREAQCRHIHVQPVGFPFPENLKAWLPGVLASWQERSENKTTQVGLGTDGANKPELIQLIIKAMTDQPHPVTDISTITPSLGRPGWNLPPDFDFHLLVCVGPRCQVHGSSPFLQRLQQQIRKAGLQKRCLVTKTGCIYPCNKGPVLALYPHGDWYRLTNEASLERFVQEALLQNSPVPDLIFYRARLANAVHAPFPSDNEMETH